eukprot:3536922-Amphidinium_carterae.1
MDTITALSSFWDRNSRSVQNDVRFPVSPQVLEGTSAFTHVDVGDFNEDNRKGRAYPPAVDTHDQSLLKV